MGTGDWESGTGARGAMARPLGMTLVAALLLGLTVGMSAHELGTTRVVLRMEPAQAYTVTITTDAAALLEKLESVSGVSAEVPESAALLEARLRAQAATFGSRVSLTFDQEPAAPQVEMRVSADTPGTPPAAVVTLRGHAPADAEHFAWTYGWTFASYALTAEAGHGSAETTVWLDGTTTSGPLLVPAAETPAERSSWLATARQYLVLGFTHILPLGPDHVLFVLGLFLLNSRPRTLLAQVSAFTVAHSLTLGLSMFGLLSAPSAIVEPAIAISIACVAAENLLLSELRAWRLWLVFGCGLLHGLGFAGVLHELGLPREQFITALLSFNVGVEVAQLTVLAVALAAVGVWFSHRSWYRARVVIPGSVAIAGVALFWTVERLAG